LESKTLKGNEPN